MTRDVDSAKAFYTEVFGWDIAAQDMGSGGIYHLVQGGENGGWCGIVNMPAEMPDMVPNHWMVYFAVTDVDAIRLPGVGRMATVHDPAGGSFSVMHPEATA